MNSITDQLYMEHRARKSLPFPSSAPYNGLATSGAGGFGGQLSYMPGWIGNFGQNFAGTGIDFGAAVGKPTSSSLVMALARWLGTAVAQAPVVVKEVKEGEDRKAAKIVPGHQLTQRMARPNTFYSGATMWKAVCLSWLIDGNGYLVKLRNIFGDVVQFWYVPHFMIGPAWDRTNPTAFITHYVYKVDGNTYFLRIEDVVHIRNGIDPENPRVGLSPIKSVLREIFSDNEAANYTAALVKNAGVPPWAIIPKVSEAGAVTEIDANRIKEQALLKTTGDRRGEPLVLTDAVDIKLLAFDPNKMALRELRRVPEERVASVTGIHPMVVGFGAGLERSTMANYEEAAKQSYDNVVKPLWTDIGDECTVQVLERDYKEGPNKIVGHDTSDVNALQEDQGKVAERASKLYTSGVWTREEARSATGKQSSDPDNPEADKVFNVSSSVSLLTPEGGDVLQLDSKNPAGDSQGRTLKPVPARDAQNRTKLPPQTEEGGDS